MSDTAIPLDGFTPTAVPAARRVDEVLHRRLVAEAQKIAENIRRSGKTIYDPIEVGDPTFWFSIAQLQALVGEEIRGMQLGQPNKARSKLVKTRVCEILGYAAPEAFTRENPGIPGQDLFINTQASNNFQPVNKHTEIKPTRRYLIVQQTAAKLAGRVKVVTGERMAELDRTGTLTKKYQATYRRPSESVFLGSKVDTPRTASLVRGIEPNLGFHSPVEVPSPDTLLSIAQLRDRLGGLIGRTIPYHGDQLERSHGDAFHELVCSELGYKTCVEDGACPDIKHQLIEVKLQRSPTIDIGLMPPDSEAPLDMPPINGIKLLHRDVRYVVAGATLKGDVVEIDHITLTTGADFFNHMPRFEGNVQNVKRQIRIPKDFFDT